MAWYETRVTKQLGIAYPIILAPMAGGTTTPQLVAAISNAGGLGSLGAGYLTPEQISAAIRSIRDQTDRPFAVNLFVPEPVTEQPDKMKHVNVMMQKYRDELGIGEAPVLSRFAESFEEQIAVVLEEKVPAFSFTFGLLQPEWIEALKANGTTIIGTATTVKEAMVLERSGVDIICGQGSEAGGHRGTFLGVHSSAMIGTMALIPQMVNHVNIPVIAAGGIMDGRGIAAAMALGADAVQMGTAFMTTPESGTHVKHKEAILHSTEESTTITRAFSGKPARGIRNRFLNEMELHENIIPDYPIQNGLTRDIRKAAAEQLLPEYFSLWAGQGTRLSRSKTAKEIFSEVVEQTESVMQKFR